MGHPGEVPDRLRRLIGGDVDERTSVDEFRRRLARLGTITHEQEEEAAARAADRAGTVAPSSTSSPGPAPSPSPSPPSAPRPAATARQPRHPRMAPVTGAADVAALATPLDTLPNHHPWRRIPAVVLAAVVGIVLVLWVIGVTTGDDGDTGRPLQRT